MATGRSRLWYVLLLVPFIALLWVAFDAKVTPKVFGFPFFYWYQFLWVPLTALITIIVYRATRSRRPDEHDSRVRGDGHRASP